MSDDGSSVGSACTYDEEYVVRLGIRHDRQALPITEPMCNQSSKRTPIRSGVRSIKIGHGVVGDRFKVRRVMRIRHEIVVECCEGRRSKSCCSSFGIICGHHCGVPCACSPKRNRVWMVRTDVMTIRWATIGGVAFHGFAWPRAATECKSIVRALFANHFQWADVFVVRGRCFCSHRGRHAGNRTFVNLSWGWSSSGRPSLVYKEGGTHIGGGYQVPKWFEGSQCHCSYFCQCNLVSQCQGAWHHPGH